MSKPIRTFLLLTPLIFLLVIPLFGQAQCPITPLTGLTYEGKPSNIPVPLDLPEDFVKYADFLLIQHELRFEDSVSMLVFAGPLPSGNASWTITAWATNDCPKFMALNYYNLNTEEDRNWIWNIDQAVKEVSGDEYLKFQSTICKELAETYCKSFTGA